MFISTESFSLLPEEEKCNVFNGNMICFSFSYFVFVICFIKKKLLQLIIHNRTRKFIQEKVYMKINIAVDISIIGAD